jgi:exodeoxyribonuclease VII large subunit
MSDLFDLPFEDEDEREAEPEVGPPAIETRPSPASGSPAAPRARPSNDGSAPVALTSTDPLPRPAVINRPPPPPDAQPRSAGTIRQAPSAERTPEMPIRRVWSVTELTVGIRDRLESEFFEIWVEGELSNCKVWNTGHLYFTLKDSGAQIRGVIFRTALRYLRFKPADGLRVVARGRVSVYEPKGEYQLLCEHMEPQGLGALQLAFDRLKTRLQAEGLFESDRKRPLPVLPRKIGIVTSLEGAAIRDMITVLTRRYANAHIVIRPTRVQGEGAASEIARALRSITRVPGVDVVIVGRGGGSIEDLWAFNEEVVARAIERSPVPIVSGVGHESDVTIADFVADLRAPTPSAAAELVVARHDDFRSRIDWLTRRLVANARNRVHGLSRLVHVLTARPALAGIPGRVVFRGRHTAELTHALATAGRAAVAVRQRRLQQLVRQLDAFDPGRRLAATRTRLVTADGRLLASVRRAHNRADARLRACAGRLDTLSPLAVLGRGYAVCWTGDGSRILRRAVEVQAGDGVRVTLAMGEIECQVLRTIDAEGDAEDRSRPDNGT